ncbi:hypothetical protein BCR43DRAFT_527125 [Syncephalastrum racemosum]|uniref:Uncharacterized protein n=1 Tax=Syncephalastrum racemosum TaxID=13706 RepID=A0A1X2H5B2_SYNRA|nr:hypothetical protein BCR43DRAFT_527125 [Syncephalastrum racemosum]
MYKLIKRAAIPEGRDKPLPLKESHDRLVDIIQDKALFDMDQAGTYSTYSSVYGEVQFCLLVNLTEVSYPPVVIEVQHVVSKMRAIRYCLHGYQQYKQHPIILIFCVKNIVSHSLAATFTAHPRIPYCLQTPSVHFASDVMLTARDSIWQKLVDDTLLLVLAIADLLVVCVFAAYLQYVCGTLQHPVCRDSRFPIPADADRAVRYATDAQAYCSMLQIKYGAMTANNSVTPLQAPEEVQHIAVDRTSPADDKFVDADWQLSRTSRAKRTGRMNWSLCYHDYTFSRLGHDLAASWKINLDMVAQRAVLTNTSARIA